MRKFSTLLRQWRKERGIKIADAAKNLGVSTATWGHWEQGRRFPRAEALLSISRYTRISLEHFFCPNSHRCQFRSTGAMPVEQEPASSRKKTT